ncbi:YjbH domain-containing protein [Gymnodinialimonas hymeniacidonis]|uniref:YjbH domain-containing protein n=1 Tax=Gymnodinialimonas hymeniacidonis TaxID=3126508 RepID=UPI0034C6BE19
MRRIGKLRFSVVALSVGLGCGVSAQAIADDTSDLFRSTTVNTYGLPGLIDMPTANALPDGELSFTVSHSSVGTRGTLAFQVLPSVTTTFRYSAIDFANVGRGRDLLFDRSFDLHWQILEERGWFPAVAVGVRDIAGTGIYSGEYVVATRHFGEYDQLAVTGGIGWGRLGGRNSFTNPLGAIDERFETRPSRDVGNGGTVNADQFFRGDAAFFGGLEWQASDRLRVQVEYSSEIYARETADGLIDASSPFNIAASYAFSDTFIGSAYVLGGDTVGFSLQMTLNPNRPAVPPSAGDPAPRPVAVRAPSAEPYATDWVEQPGGGPILRDNFAQLFEDQGLHLERLTVDAHRATIRVRNTRYNYESQALGRVLRAMSAALPPSVEVFEVIFVVEGIDTSRVRIARSDLELLEFDPGGAEVAIAVAEIEDARTTPDPVGLEVEVERPRFTWGIGPYLNTSVFDPDNPFLFDLGVEFSGQYRFGNGFVADGLVRAPIVGTLDQAAITNDPPSNPPPVVRSDGALYHQESHIYVDRLTFSHYGRPGENLYSRVTVGYLERMFAGVSGELLWQPANSRLGLGVELNHVWQREYDGLFGLRDYDVTSGHVSAYYRLNDSFDLQVDAGRYLAGDWGTTIALERSFDNGWRVGAFATFTDVSFESFGEGSFDKGLVIEIPLAWFTGNSTRDSRGGVIRPVLRDGGARLDVDGRLHDMVIDYTRPSFEETESMIWR